MPEDPRIVERRVDLPSAPPRVWEALTDPREISAWFGAEATIEPRRGGRATFRWADGRERGGVVEAADPGHALAFRWLPFERSPEGERRMVGPGRVEFLLEPSGDGTRLTVREWLPAEDVGPAFATAARSVR